MQKPCESEKLPRRVGTAEHLINFRPSPNFKNMKKFIKSKIDHTEICTQAQAVSSMTVKKEEPVQPKVQPPLPLVPPPPDVPWTPITIKKEITETDYADSCNNSEQTSGLNTEEGQTEEDSRPVCRDWIRGTCKRMDNCRYAHRYDLTQLYGVYTFCREFQTGVCTRVNCRYVHCDIFDEQKFYRTGVLPDHAFAHQTSTTTSVATTGVVTPGINTGPSIFMPPPPPPPPPPEEPHPVPNIIFDRPPPPIPSESDRLLSEIKDPILDLLQPNPLKRSWSTAMSGTLPDAESQSRCDCNKNEYFIDHMLLKLQRRIVNSETLKVKLEKIEKQINKYNDIIMRVLKSNVTSTYNAQRDRDKTQLLEQLATLLGK